MSRDLSRLLRPRSIAVVGGGAWCANVIRSLEKIGYSGALFAVHPTREAVEGVRTVARVEDLPVAPDATFIGVNRHATVEIVQALAAQGAGGAVCFASGFREAGAELADGEALEAKLLEAAGDMPVLGPNCYGWINGLDQVCLWPDLHGMVPVERGVAIVAQSSNIALNLTMQARGLPIAYLATVGNQAQVDLAELGRALLADDRVTALGLFMEGIRDLKGFEKLAEAARRAGKPIVAMKIGASEQAQIAAISHTASLAGSAAGSSALLRRLGIGQARSLTEFLEALKLLHVTGPLRSNRIASMSCSGGEASLMADTALGYDVEFPPLDDAQSRALRAALGPKVALANPLDYHTYIWGDRAALTECYSAMMGDGDLGIGCVILDFPREDLCGPSPLWDDVVEAVAEAQVATGRPIALVSSIPEALPEEVSRTCAARGIATLAGLGDAMAAISIAACETDAEAAPIWLPGPDGSTVLLSEDEAKGALAFHGVERPRSLRAEDLDHVSDLAARIGGTVVVKGEGVAHKTEAGAVALNLTTPAGAKAAAERMACDSFLVEEQITGTVAELLVGVLRDPAHGFVLTLGAGGVLTEILGDVQHLLLPVTRNAVAGALDRLKIAPLLAGYRGNHAANREAIIYAVMAIQNFVKDNVDRVHDVEINPLLCTPKRAVMADALIRWRETE